MPQTPVQTSAFRPDTRLKPAPSRHRTAERLALSGGAALGVLALALWQIPPMLDWSRYKGAIASYAGARLGRHVTIDGHVSLSLLPRATLTADGVTLADRGDGISARLGTMRLEVSLPALMGGKVVPRTLTLDNPAASLPWPIPRGAAPHARPAVSAEFSASLMGGVLHIGGLTLRDIAASLNTDPDSGAFGAQGSAMVAGLPWRFTALVGAKAADGGSPLTLTLDGQAPYGKARAVSGLLGTGGAFHGRLLADGTLAGRLVLRGPNLAVFGPAPALPWQAQGDIRGDSITLRAPRMHLTLGSADGNADIALGLGAKLALSLQASFGRIALDDWAWTALRAAPAMAGRLPAELDISAATALLKGDTIRALHLAVSLGNAGAVIRTASAGLPGGAALDFTGAMPAQGGFAGRFHLQAPDARRTLHWLTGGGSDGLPEAVARQADLAGTLDVTAERAALSGLAGRIDGSAVSGSMVFGLARRPSIGVDLDTDRLSLADWLPWIRPDDPARHGVPVLGRLASPFLRDDASIKLRVAHLDIPGLPPGLALAHAVIDAEGGQGGLTLHRSTAAAAGGQVTFSGSVGADGTLASGQAEFTTPDAALLPPSWRVPATLWHGPLHVAVNAAGRDIDTEAQLRADLGDLRAEAEAHIDRMAPRIAATVTLRHPGAPRLLAEAGWPGADAWLEHGSLALLTHVVAVPGHVQVRDFSIAAAALHAGGALDADFSGAVPAVTGVMDAEWLALPAPAPDDAAALPWDALKLFQADIAVRAAHVLAALRPVAADATAHLLVSGGVAALHDITATLAGGLLTAQAAADATQNPPLLSATMRVSKLHWTLPEAGGQPPETGVAADSADAQGAITARGVSVQALMESANGMVSGTAANVTLTGIDLAALNGANAALGTRGPHARNAVTAALRSGQTTGLAGDFAAELDDGSLRFSHATLSGTAGSLSGAGTIDLRSFAAAGRGGISPAVPGAPVVAFSFAGTWPDVVKTADPVSSPAVRRPGGRRRARK